MGTQQNAPRPGPEGEGDSVMRRSAQADLGEDALEVDEEEAEALAAMVEGYEVELSRQMLQEGERVQSEED